MFRKWWGWTPQQSISSTPIEVESSTDINPLSPTSASPSSFDDVDIATSRYPSRVHKPPNRFGYSSDDFGYSCYSPSFSSFLTSIHNLSESTSYKEVICDPLWQHAIDEELSALHKTGTWDLVALPPGQHAIWCK